MGCTSMYNVAMKQPEITCFHSFLQDEVLQSRSPELLLKFFGHLRIFNALALESTEPEASPPFVHVHLRAKELHFLLLPTWFVSSHLSI